MATDLYDAGDTTRLNAMRQFLSAQTEERETDTSPILTPDQLCHLVGLIQDDVTLNRAKYQEVHDRLMKIEASHERLRTRWRRAQDAHLKVLSERRP